MSEMRFDGRVAVVTGGGRGLGRSYALLLASRGAKLVVNDIGASMFGDATDEDPADALVSEIKAAGGEAVANKDTVATEEGGKAIIQTAMDAFGRIDIVIHNAGFTRRKMIHEMDYADMREVVDVHLMGGYHVLRPAFPIMMAQKYGRFVMTSSINGLYGKEGILGYSAGKAGLQLLSNVTALEGREYNIKSNVIVPNAVTRLSDGIDTSQFPPLEPEKVAPMVAWLAHEDCSVSGEIFAAGAGRMSSAYIAETHGMYLPEWQIEDVAANINTIRDQSPSLVFHPIPQGHMDHLLHSFAMARKGKEQ